MCIHNPAYEQFGNSPGIGWIATAAGGFYKAGDKFQVNPNLEAFKLERVVDVRTRLGSKPESFKLILIDASSKTNIFIDGPDHLIDILLNKLPLYINKPWTDIINIRLEKSFLDCDNFLVDNKCNPWVIDKLELKEIRSGQETPYFNSADLVEVGKICAKCDKFLERIDKVKNV